MVSKTTRGIDRRTFLVSSLAAAGGAVAPALAENEPAYVTAEREIVRRNMSSFRSLDWHPYFSNLKNGVILVDTVSRSLHFWSEDGATYKLFPTSVPLTEEMTRRGRTSVVRKVIGPDWRPAAPEPPPSSTRSRAAATLIGPARKRSQLP